MAHFKTLNIWKNSILLTKDIYVILNNFPTTELYSLTDQIKRAASSVSANIAEGEGRGSIQDNIRFLHIARGSLAELQSHIHLARELGFVSEAEASTIDERTEELGKMISGYISHKRKLLSDPSEK